MRLPGHALVIVVAALLLATPAAAQRTPAGIDPLSASIYGRVTSDGGAPIRRAEVRAMNERGISRLATSDADGRYELRDMPAGTYRLVVSKSGFVTLGLDQRRTTEEARTITLGEGQRVAASFALPRAGAITGRVVDDAGEPVADVRVQALRSRIVEGTRRLLPFGVIDTTDDTGSYRVFGLEPGEYYITALVSSPTPEDARMSAVTGPLRGDVRSTVPVFYPGAPSLDQAQPVTVGVGGDVRADIFLAPLRTATVSGAVLNSTGSPAADATIELRSEALSWGFSPAGPMPLLLSAHANADGSFELPNVPPGSYTLLARAQNQRARGALDALLTAGALNAIDRFKGQNPNALEATKAAMNDMAALEMNMSETASMPVVVGNTDVTGLSLVTSSGTLTATMVADAGVTRPLPREGELRTSGAHVGMMNVSTNNSVRQLRLLGVSGPVRVTVDGLPPEWAVKAVMLDGADVTDQPINVRGNVEVRVVLTDRVTEVNGVVASGPGDARDASDTRGRYVVVFPADTARWTYPSRFVRSARADAQGRFEIKGLPPNDRYLALAVDYLDQGEAADPQFLERMRSRATPFSLTDGERRTIDVRLVPR